MRYLIGRATIRMVLAALLVSMGVTLTGGTTPLRRAPVPLLAIDCGFGQPCTGTTCITNTTTHYCDTDPNSPVECEADSQQYSGGDQISCTDRTICDRCVVRGRNVSYLSYTGGSGACTPNH
jgi:hypothetical protein